MEEKAPDLVWDASEFVCQAGLSEAWNALCVDLAVFMQKVNPGGSWYCEVRHFGWRPMNGYLDIEAYDGPKLLSKILPKTECTFKIWLDEEGKKITIDNAHHDKPTGGEMYYIRPKEE